MTLAVHTHRMRVAPAHAPVPSGQKEGNCLLFDSFAEVPAVWHELCGDDLGMDPKVLHVFQRTLGDQCRCWGVVVYDDMQVAIACAALCFFKTELIEATHPAVMLLRDGVRRIWPSFARMGVLFCGLPVPSGSTHVRIRPGASAEKVIAELDGVMQRLCRSVGGRLVVFKELGRTCAPLAQVLLAARYIRGDIPPMHELHGNFSSFAEYSGALKSRYRAQVRRSQKKLQEAGFEVLHGRGSDFFTAHFDGSVHALYLAMQARAEHKLERMPLSFFLCLAAALGPEASLMLIRRHGRMCAFTFAVTRGTTHYNLYSGLDYALNAEGDLYFNLFYNDLDQAFRAGATSVHLGQTSDDFKSRLGAVPQTLSFFARAPSPWFHELLRRFAWLAFPRVSVGKPHDVFASGSSAC